MKCPKCNGVMEEGVQVDYAQNGPNWSKWATDIKGQIFKKTEGEKYIKTYRCKDCGFLESYAK